VPLLHYLVCRQIVRLPQTTGVERLQDIDFVDYGLLLWRPVAAGTLRASG
jgi:hypothetical protein